MIGIQPPPQSNLFYVGFNIDPRVRKDHPLRTINELVDFDFAHKEVELLYGTRDNVSVPPPVILKLMLLLILYNVRSERELMDTLPERLDWLWFLGCDLDSEIPNHSVLSKARKKWGVEIFRSFFEHIVIQCVEAGLVNGNKLFIDSSLVNANASSNSVIDTRNLKHQLYRGFKKLEARLDEKDAADSFKLMNARCISTTDPDAAIVNRGKPKLAYQVHRAVDEQCEIITAATATPGDVNEAHYMLDLVEQHEATTAAEVQAVVADSKYGIIDNYLACNDRGIEAHIPAMLEANRTRFAKLNIFQEESFRYDPETDTYRCPSGNVLKPKSLHIKRHRRDYAAPKKICMACALRQQCTRNKFGRTVKRHLRRAELDQMREKSRSVQSK